MCGRFVRKSSIRDIARLWQIPDIDCDLQPSFNVAPRQPVAVVMDEGRKKLVTMQWGLIPSWSKDEKIANKLINARSETIDEKPSYRNAFKKRRCVIVADGFFEWKKQDDGKKVPMFIYMKDRQPFGMAGLYEQWRDADGQIRTTCTIITTEANEFMKNIHHRMPVILSADQFDLWLDPSNTNIAQLKTMLLPLPPDMLDSHEVSKAVNSPANNSEYCIKPYVQDGN